MTSVSTTKAIAPNSALVPAHLVLAGVLASLALLGGCQPKSASQPQSVSQTEPAPAPMAEAVPNLSTTAPAPQNHATEAARPPKSASRAAKTDVAAAGGKVMTIAGGWVNAGGACDSGASVFFNLDGTYMSEGEKGTWALSGKTLTVTTSNTLDEGSSQTQGPDESTGDSGEKAVLTLLSLTDDTARVVLSNGNSARWTRCNS
jgi:hypothetical protein